MVLPLFFVSACPSFSNMISREAPATPGDCWSLWEPSRRARRRAWTLTHVRRNRVGAAAAAVFGPHFDATFDIAVLASPARSLQLAWYRWKQTSAFGFQPARPALVLAEFIERAGRALGLRDRSPLKPGGTDHANAQEPKDALPRTGSRTWPT